MNKALDNLESLFANDESVRVTRGENSITFEQDFTDNIAITADIFQKEHMVFKHTVTIKDGKYKTIDTIENSTFGPGRNDMRELSKINFSMGTQRGHFRLKGFTYGIGKDNLNGGMLIRQPWSTEYIKAPVRECLENSGLEKEKLSIPKWVVAILVATLGLTAVVFGIIFL